MGELYFPWPWPHTAAFYCESLRFDVHFLQGPLLPYPQVRQAIFNMLQSQAGTVNCLPATARWLDLFAGTGPVGLEALSRGCREVHFIEMDPWVTRNVLGKNIATCSFQRQVGRGIWKLA